MHCFHCLCPLHTFNCTITGLVCVYLKCRFNEFSLSTMTAIVFWMEIEQSDVFFSSVSIKAWKSYFKYTHTAIYKADLETKGWRGKWKRHHKELPAWTSIRNVLSLLPAIIFIFEKKPLYCRHHGWGWSLTCDWSQQLGVVVEKCNPFAPLQAH